MNETLYGKEVADKMDAADAALAAVNEKYKDYFSSIPSKYAQEGEDTPATLSEFTVIHWDAHSAGIGFSHGLRDDIIEEARQAFEKSVRG